jgi:hypothetical protein
VPKAVAGVVDAADDDRFLDFVLGRLVGAVDRRPVLARLADPARPIQTVTVPTKLIVRGSGELPAGRDST